MDSATRQEIDELRRKVEDLENRLLELEQQLNADTGDDDDDRELDAAVAEKVMGWGSPRQRGGYSLYYMDDGTARYVGNVPWQFAETSFQPTTYTADDYEVLRHVRETWNESLRIHFVDALRETWKGRAIPLLWRNSWEQFYEPGDYSRAALAVLDSRESEAGHE